MRDGLRAHIVVERAGFQLDVELEVAAGSTVALLGPNGAGKSTVIDALVGAQPLTAGRIELAGRVLDEPASGTWVPTQDRRLGVVFQRYFLFDHLSVIDNVAFGLRSAGQSRRLARESAQSWLDMIGVGSFARRYPRELSGGQAQRVALARALAIEPVAVLLDEPMAALDIEVRADLRRLLGGVLRDIGAPRLLITHDPADAFLLADRICVMEDGRITQSGTPTDLRRRPVTSYAAALAGVNLLTGTSDAGVITVDDCTTTLQTADTRTAGRVLVTIHPNAIALHQEQPHGSPRNTWSTTIKAVEPVGDVVRVTLDDPFPLGADVTPGAVEALGLVAGRSIWASVKATEIDVHPA